MVAARAIGVAAAIGCAAGGCKEFATPADLDRDQILAIVTEPPSVGLGERSAVSILVAGPSGELAPAVGWSMMELAAGVAPVGSVEVDPDGGATYLAPDQRPPELPTAGLLRAEVASASEPMIGVKAVVVGEVGLANPVVAGFSADGEDLLASPEITAAAGDAVAIAVELDAPDDDDAMFAWYTSLGTIERYRSNPTELVADEVGEGWLFVVVRDGLGGVAWRKAHLTVVD
jgi:hypothetical protein